MDRERFTSYLALFELYAVLDRVTVLLASVEISVIGSSISPKITPILKSPKSLSASAVPTSFADLFQSRPFRFSDYRQPRLILDERLLLLLDSLRDFLVSSK